MSISYCAQVEGRSWPEAGDPLEVVYGYRHYSLQCDDLATCVDIVKPWRDSDKPYRWVLISDELCVSNLPFYVPFCCRVGLLKESPARISTLDPGILARRFPVVFTHFKGHLDYGAPFRFLPYSSNFIGILAYRNQVSLPSVIEKTELCSFIGRLDHGWSAPGYSLRKEVYRLLRGNPNVTCFGRDTQPLERKADGLRRYAFSVAMENCRADYYFTEKLIDCLLAGTIPIYWGCPSIARFFDPAGILSFSTLRELASLLESLTFERYCELRPYVEKNFAHVLDTLMGDYHGYLHRAVSTLSATGASSRPTFLRYGRRARAYAQIRRLVS